MELKHYIRMLRDHWLLVTLCTLVATIAAGALALAQTPMYAASAQLFVSTSGEADVSQAYQGGLFSQQRVKSYADLLTSPRIAQSVVAGLRLPYTVADVQAEISASAPVDTVLINYTVTDASPVRARDIANAVGIEFSRFVAQLETPQGKTTSPVKVSVTKPAELPSSPVSPRKKVNLALGLLLGLAAGIGGAVLRESLDNTIGSKHDAAKITGAPVVGAIAEDSEARTRPLIVLDDHFSTRAEAFRQLRTNIRFLSVDQGVRSLVVTSAVANEGKTTTAANLAIVLAQAGERVVLVDADMRRPGVADMLGLPNTSGLTNVLVGDIDPTEALQVWRADLSLRVLTTGPLPPNPSELLGSQRMSQLLHDLASQFDVVVFDSPPLLPVTDAAILAKLTEGAILVTRVASTRADQLENAAEALRNVGAPVLGVVLSRLPRRGKGAAYGRSAYSYAYYDYRPKPNAIQAATHNGSAPTPATMVGREGPKAPTRILPAEPNSTAVRAAERHGQGRGLSPTPRVVDLTSKPAKVPSPFGRLPADPPEPSDLDTRATALGSENEPGPAI